MKKNEYIAGLRELADFLESRDFPDTWKSSWGTDESYPNINVSLFTYDKETFGKLTSLLGGLEKSASESYLTSHKKLANSSIQVHGYREMICEKVKVGTKIIPAKEAELVPAEPEHEEDIYEWKCPDSFLALKEESNV